jgi:hypothetical protein
VTATGSGWSAGDEVRVQWEDGIGLATLATTTVDDNGNFTVFFAVPDNTAEGEYTIHFVGVPPDGEAYTISAIFTVQVQPTITLDPTEGPPGTEVTATGSGWPVGLDVSVQWENGTVLATTTVDGNGSFTVSFTIPDDAAEGQHVIDFVGFPPDGGAYTTSAIFMVSTSTAPSFGAAGSFMPFRCDDGRLCAMHSQVHKEDTGIPTIQYHVHLSRIPKSSLDLADTERAHNNLKPGQEPTLMSKVQEAVTGGFRKAEVQLLQLSNLSELIDTLVSVAGSRVNLSAELIMGSLNR